ncbi:hypothetical protein ACL02U_09790 [Streptomyces sp. MS06]
MTALEWLLWLGSIGFVWFIYCACDAPSLVAVLLRLRGGRR